MTKPVRLGVLSAAAVISGNCSFGLLGSVLGIDEQNNLEALDELLSARLISEVPTKPILTTFSMTASVKPSTRGSARCEVFYRRALTALTDARAPSAELARHEAMCIAEHAGTPELHEVFVSHPKVQIILAHYRLLIPVSYPQPDLPRGVHVWYAAINLDWRSMYRNNDSAI